MQTCSSVTILAAFMCTRASMKWGALLTILWRTSTGQMGTIISGCQGFFMNAQRHSQARMPAFIEWASLARCMRKFQHTQPSQLYHIRILGYVPIVTRKFGAHNLWYLKESISKCLHQFVLERKKTSEYIWTRKVVDQSDGCARASQHDYTHPYCIYVIVCRFSIESDRLCRCECLLPEISML